MGTVGSVRCILGLEPGKLADTFVHVMLILDLRAL